MKFVRNRLLVALPEGQTTSKNLVHVVKIVKISNKILKNHKNITNFSKKLQKSEIPKYHKNL